MGRVCVSSPPQLTAFFACKGFKEHVCCSCSPKMPQEGAEGRCAPFLPAALFHMVCPRHMTGTVELLLQGIQHVGHPVLSHCRGARLWGPQPADSLSPTLGQH